MPNPERDIAENVLRSAGLSVSQLGLRFDRVVLRVLGALRADAEAAAPRGHAVLLTMTAPIRQPADTALALRPAIAALAAAGDGEQALTVNGNAVRLRGVEGVGRAAPTLVGFVHNPQSDPARLLDLGERWLRGDG
ncbi:hypothetical protein ACO2Q3_11800 [Caulobacter sp. KR2-114]|uniref:hypothetical protein n=1 Tax=Caulobacter sp. KR2-114 TaxID=3400912 RepID=UPI003BFAD585